MGIEETHYGNCLQCDKARQMARIWSAWCYAVWTGHAEPTEKWLLTLPKGEIILQGSCFIKASARHSTGHRRKQLMDIAITKQNRFSDFLLHEKVCWLLWACRLNMHARMLQKNFGWLSRHQDVSVNSRVLEVAYNALPIYLGNIISFWSLLWSWRIDTVIVFLVYDKNKLDTIL